MQNEDLSEPLRERVLKAIVDGSPLLIKGGGSKSFYGRHAVGEVLDLAGHSGIVAYEPTELVLTARAGTPLSSVEAALAGQGQMLAFEPPHFGPNATLGGTVACGLSGPRRPYAGSVRDSVLGVKLINGKGEILRFGGQVMKNVAGFDLSRLMAGALGTLGVLLDASLKVIPKPEAEETLCFEMTAKKALTAMNRWSSQAWPLSAACHDGMLVYVRLSGAEAAIRASARQLGGERFPAGDEFWAGLREQNLAFFQDMDNCGSKATQNTLSLRERARVGENESRSTFAAFFSMPLWRISLPPASPELPIRGSCFIDWGGALRWVKTDATAESVFAEAKNALGHATLFRPCNGGFTTFQPLPDRLKALHIQLKKAFDPKGIFNPARMYEEW